MAGENRRIVLASRPEGEPKPEDFRLEHAAVPEPGPGEALLRTLHLSLDPYMRGRIGAAKSYARGVEPGETMVGGTVSEVVRSNDPGLAPGRIVLSHVGWQDYGVAEAATLRRLDPAAAPVTTAPGSSACRA